MHFNKKKIECEIIETVFYSQNNNTIIWPKQNLNRGPCNIDSECRLDALTLTCSRSNENLITVLSFNLNFDFCSLLNFDFCSILNFEIKIRTIQLDETIESK